MPRNWVSLKATPPNDCSRQKLLIPQSIISAYLRKWWLKSLSLWVFIQFYLTVLQKIIGLFAPIILSFWWKDDKWIGKFQWSQLFKPLLTFQSHSKRSELIDAVRKIAIYGKQFLQNYGSGRRHGLMVYLPIFAFSIDKFKLKLHFFDLDLLKLCSLVSARRRNPETVVLGLWLHFDNIENGTMRIRALFY